MAIDDSDLDSTTIADFFAHVLAEYEAVAARQAFCDVVVEQTSNVAAWLGMDAFLGAGDVTDTKGTPTTAIDQNRSRSFSAVSLVAQISGELMSGALTLFGKGNLYAASALVRQLIECEYLLRLFHLDFGEASRWLGSTKKERIDSFSPKKLRKIGGFADQEYWNHCDAGGHPTPVGRDLLELERLAARLRAQVASTDEPIDATRLYRLDFALHCDRVWRALITVLSSEHARFTTVRGEVIQQVQVAHDDWLEADALARYAGVILPAMAADPNTTLGELIVG